MKNQVPLMEKSCDQWTLLLLRLVVGFGFVVHGWAKWSRGPEKFGALLHSLGVPFPDAMAWLVTSVELLGGIALLVGLWVTLISIPLIVSMLVAIFAVHMKYGYSSINTIGLADTGPLFGPPGYEINILYIAGLFTLAMRNPIPLSIDCWLEGHRGQCPPQ